MVFLHKALVLDVRKLCNRYFWHKSSYLALGRVNLSAFDVVLQGGVNAGRSGVLENE